MRYFAVVCGSAKTSHIWFFRSWVAFEYPIILVNIVQPVSQRIVQFLTLSKPQPEDENERKKLINEIKASGPVLKLVDQIIKDKIEHLEFHLESLIGRPYELACNVKTISELKKLTALFEVTHNDNT